MNHIGLLVALFLFSSTPFQHIDAGPNDREEVLRAAQGLFDAMLARDTAAVRQLFLPDGRLISTWVRNGKHGLRNLSFEQFSTMIVATKEPYRERMFDAQALVEGDVATVWGKYDFHVGTKLTNCGVNAVQLVRTADGWRISQVTSTILTEGCVERGEQ